MSHGAPSEVDLATFLGDDPDIAMTDADLVAWLLAHTCECEALCTCDDADMHQMHERCAKRVKPTPLPPSFPLEAARSHPRFRYYLEPGAQCEHEAGHDGPHRNGGLIWHDPAAVFVGGVPLDGCT